MKVSKGKIIAAIIVIALVAAAAFVFAGQKASANTVVTPTPMATVNPTATASAVPTATPTPGNVQVISIRALANGQYDHEQITVNAGTPVRLDFSAEANAGCGKQLVMRDFGVSLISRNGETVSATFTPKAPGTFTYQCGMGMWTGTLIVK
ncbi:MAG: cupredoxin domain-containing protein [Candidatus Micrarchaeia archaeon]|jgi:plastocyanin